MTVRAEVHHHWAVTRGNHPDRKPYYCPLHEPRYNAAVALYDSLTLNELHHRSRRQSRVTGRHPALKCNQHH